MKKLKYILGFVLMGLGYSCTDFVEPAIPYNTFETGVYLRTITPPTNVNFFAMNTARFTIVLDAVDEEDGNLVQEVDVYVRRRRANTLTTEVKVTTVPKTAFASNTSTKYQRATIDLPLSQALSAMSMTTADINGGDFFEWRLDLLDTKGRRFTNSNVSADIVAGTFYASPFFYRVPVVCPSNNLQGTYAYSSSNMMSVYGSCPGTITGNVTFTQVTGSPNAYIVSDATFGFWNCYGDTFTGTGVRLNDACGKLSFSGTDKYGDTYQFFFISNDGTTLRFRWVNASAEEGTVNLTANATPWPSNLK